MGVTRRNLREWLLGRDDDDGCPTTVGQVRELLAEIERLKAKPPMPAVVAAAVRDGKVHLWESADDFVGRVGSELSWSFAAWVNGVEFHPGRPSSEGDQP